MAEQRATIHAAESPPRQSLRELYYELGRALLYNDRAKEGAAAFEQAAKETGEQPTLFAIAIARATALTQANDKETAFRSYLEAAAAEPEHLEQVLADANELVSTDLAAAVKPWLESEWFPRIQRASLNGAQRVQLALFLGKISVDAKDYPRALEVLTQSASGTIVDATLRNEMAESLHQIGTIFYEQGDYASSIVAFRNANRLRPDHVLTSWYLVDALRIKNRNPTRPYVPSEEIRESLQVWERAIVNQLPGEDDSWAYLARADVNEELARIPGSDRWKLGWEAVSYCERATLLWRQNAARYVALGRWYRFLCLPACEYQATATALEIDDDDTVALEERILCLVNAGRYDEVAPLIAKRWAIDKSAWADAVQAYIKLRQKVPEEALSLIEPAIKELSDQLWCYELRAECYQQLDRASEAVCDYQRILDQYHPDCVEESGRFGSAAYLLGLKNGDLDRAIEIYQLTKSYAPPTDHSPLLGLGQCYLAKGEFEHGLELLHKGLELCRKPRDLEDLLNFDLLHLENASRGFRYQVELSNILNDQEKGVKVLVRRRLQALTNNPPSPEIELRELLNSRAPGDADGFLMIGAGSGLARLYSDQKRWSESAEWYQTLLKPPAWFSEARAGLDYVAGELQTAGDQHLQEGMPHEALGEFTRALKLLTGESSPSSLQRERLPAYLVRLGDLYGRIGYTYFILDESAEARQNFRQALQLYRMGHSDDPGGALGVTCVPLLRYASDYWSLDEEWKSFRSEAPIDQELQKDLRSAERSLAAYLQPVSRIVIEVGSELLRLETEENWPIFELLDDMRNRVKNETGVQLPGALLRDNSQLHAVNYVIKFDEISLDAGTVEIDRRFCVTSPETLKQLGIPEQSLHAARNPLSAETGYWVEQEWWEPLKRAGAQLWERADLFIVHHLEAVCRLKLRNFLGFQEVTYMLAGWRRRSREKDEQGGRPKIASVRDVDTDLRIARLLATLVHEKVPITALPEILEAAEAAGLGEEVTEAGEAVRLRLRQGLPGNQFGTKRIELDPALEEEISRWICQKEGKTFVAVPLSSTQALSRVFIWMHANARNAVLVSRRSELRPYIKRLAESQFPEMIVLSAGEVLAENDFRAQIRSTAEMATGEAK